MSKAGSNGKIGSEVGGKMTPKFTIMKYEDVSKDRSVKEFCEICSKIQPIVEKYTGRRSLWSGTVLIETKSPAKLWNCSIRLPRDAPDHVLLHEMIHASSISYFGIKDYTAHLAAEELSVHYLSQELANISGMKVIESGYAEGVELIRDLKRMLKSQKTDLELATELIRKSPSERWELLEELIVSSITKETTLGEYQSWLNKLEAIKSWTRK